MHEQHILFVGYRDAPDHINGAKKAGAKLFLLIDVHEIKPHYHELFDEVYIAKDIFDWNEVSELIKNRRFDAVLTRYEDFTVLVSAIAEMCKLPGVPWEKAANFRNKYLMRTAFAEANAPSADFVLISKLADAEQFIATHEFPFILKQIAGIHSKYVAKVKNKGDLKKTLEYFQNALCDGVDNMQKELKNFPQKIETPCPRTHFLLEECITGEELSVDAYVGDGEIFFTPICRYVTSEELNINDQHLPLRIMEYDLPQKTKELILHTCTQGIRALGANYCLTHTEVFYDAQKGECRLIEIASRGGGSRGEMLEYARGVDYHLQMVNTALGRKPDLLEKCHKYVVVGEIFSPENGILEEIDISVLNSNKNTFLLKTNVHVGQKVGRASDGCAYILKFLLHGTSYKNTLQEAIEVHQKIQSSIRLRK